MAISSTEKIKKTKKLTKELDSFMKQVTIDNYNGEGITHLVLAYKYVFSKSEILRILCDYYMLNCGLDAKFDKWQEEALGRIQERIFGFCSKDSEIPWDD